MTGPLPRLAPSRNSVCRLLLLVAVASSLGFFAAKRQSDNELAGMDVSMFLPARAPDFDFNLERCAVLNGKLWVSGWLTRIGEAPLIRSTRVVLIDGNETPALALRTSMDVRNDLAGRLAPPPGQSRPPVAGFSASLALARSGIRLKDATVAIAYEHGRIKALARTGCHVTWPQ